MACLGAGAGVSGRTRRSGSRSGPTAAAPTRRRGWRSRPGLTDPGRPRTGSPVTTAQRNSVTAATTSTVPGPHETLSDPSRIIGRMPFTTGAMVGRDSDLARLAGAVGLIDSPDGSRGGVAVLSGDAGIGKSRLLLQLTSDADQAGWLTVTGHCVGQAGSALAYLPFVELIGLLDSMAPDVVTQVLGSHPSLARLLPRREGDTAGITDSAKEANPGLVAESVHALFTALGADRPTLTGRTTLPATCSRSC